MQLAKRQIRSLGKLFPFLGELLQDEDAEKANRVMEAMLQMDKIDIKALKQAYEQK